MNAAADTTPDTNPDTSHAAIRDRALGALLGLAVGDAVVVRPLDHRAEPAADRGCSHICRGLKFMGIDSPGAFQASWTVPAFTVHRLPPGVDLRVEAGRPQNLRLLEIHNWMDFLSQLLKLNQPVEGGTPSPLLRSSQWEDFANHLTVLAINHLRGK